MSKDLIPVLEGWEFLPSKVTARLIDGLEGKSKLQLRIDLGVLQMELDGRPDGRTPMGMESYYAHFLELASAVADDADFAEGLGLGEDDGLKLQQEAVQYYHRYLALFQLEDWPRVIRDTQRNLDLFDFVGHHAEDAALGELFHPFRPYAQMMNARAWAHLWIEHGELKRALEVIEQGIESIKAFCLGIGKPEMLHGSEELRFLETWQLELQASPEGAPEKRLEQALEHAVEREDYESAAELRDKIKQVLQDKAERAEREAEATVAKPSSRGHELKRKKSGKKSPKSA
ncbi:MAG: UvrB/UvrC motif-containing protein [Verrucomicrobiota bacterium]